MIKNFIVIQLNEFNFELANRYIADGADFPNLSTLLDHWLYQETNENVPYEKLEPWIQWTSVYTGMTADEHNIFTLGDLAMIENSHLATLFERLEKQGIPIGLLSAMGAPNRLIDPEYFIPDPWTNTKSDNSFFSKTVHRLITQTVNNNAEGKITKSSAISLVLLFVFLFRFNLSKYWNMFKLVWQSIRKGNRWRKCLVLDALIHEIHNFKLNRSNPHLSFVFFNGQAHLQHHYLLNSKYSNLKNPSWYITDEMDPVKEGFKFYDRLLGEYLKYKETTILVATGLSQATVTKKIIYNRLLNPVDFFSNFLGFSVTVSTRMTRDLELAFDTWEALIHSKKILESLRVSPSQKVAFGFFSEVGNNLKCSFIFDDHVSQNDEIAYDGKAYSLYSNTAFVALKNGEHVDKGFIFHNAQNFKDCQIDTCAELGRFIEKACVSEL